MPKKTDSIFGTLYTAKAVVVPWNSVDSEWEPLHVETWEDSHAGAWGALYDTFERKRDYKFFELLEITDGEVRYTAREIQDLL